MLRLNFPVASYASSDVSLGGFTYKFVYKFNEADLRWRIDIYYNEIPVLLGIKVMEDASVIGLKYDTPLFKHGIIFCIKSLEDGLEAGRSNIGIGKPYELVYFSNEELADA